MTNTKELARTFYDILDAQRWDAALELVSPQVRSHMGGADLDRDGWIGMGKMFYAAFPDGKHEILQIVAEGDRVVLIGAFSGTHRASFQGIPPTGRKIRTELAIALRFVEGRVVEHWGVFDSAGLMQQLTA
jgi:predicted ester cyclase